MRFGFREIAAKDFVFNLGLLSMHRVAAVTGHLSSSRVMAKAGISHNFLLCSEELYFTMA